MDRLLVQDGSRWLRFTEEVRRIEARRAADVVPALAAVEAAVEGEGLAAVGFVAYEAAAAWGLPVRAPDPSGPPLLWFALTRRWEECPPPRAGSPYRLGQWRPRLGRDGYLAAVARIREHLAAGDTYQVNFTFALDAAFAGDPASLMADLAGIQRARTMAYVDTGRFVVCSASPELFLDRRGEQVASRPMKGTASRGRSTADDDAAANALARCPKSRAENLMIVDMVRNDLGRVAEVGSVEVPELYAVERYPTLLQLTSTVTARTRSRFADLLGAAFPCASVTGAPKRRTMELIAALEAAPRGVYTGAVGALLPGRVARLNVAIRTVVVDRQRGTATYGVGSGVVWDSDAASEYEECRLKTAVLARPEPDFELLESLRWTPGEGFWLLGEHLARLAASARYFGFPHQPPRVADALLDAIRHTAAESKVRLLLARDGAVRATAEPLDPGPHEPLRVALAPATVDPTSLWLYHKTTRRELYEAARADRPDADEVLLHNPAGEVTEATTANLVVELDGRLLTPPVACGLLPGTLREAILREGRVAERRIFLRDLPRASRLWLVSSVRGWREAVLVDG